MTSNNFCSALCGIFFFLICFTFSAAAQDYAHQIIIGGEEQESPQSYDFARKGAVTVPPAFEMMLGRWQSIYDEEEVIQFIPGRYITYYAGQKVVEETMNYQEQCPMECYPGIDASSSVVCFQLADNCFAILLLDENELHIGLPGMDEESGLVYRRVLE